MGEAAVRKEADKWLEPAPSGGDSGGWGQGRQGQAQDWTGATVVGDRTGCPGPRRLRAPPAGFQGHPVTGRFTRAAGASRPFLHKGRLGQHTCSNDQQQPGGRALKRLLHCSGFCLRTDGPAGHRSAARGLRVPLPRGRQCHLRACRGPHAGRGSGRSPKGAEPVRRALTSESPIPAWSGPGSVIAQRRARSHHVWPLGCERPRKWLKRYLKTVKYVNGR